jgi:spore germination cell wall hydrolase CwlJ-like protein
MNNRRFTALGLLALCLLAGHVGRAHTYQEKAVAAVLMGEAWGEGTTGMIAVGEVVRERSVRLNRTPLKVVTARGRGVHAFSCLNGTNIDALIRKFAKVSDYQTALEIARTVCRTPEQLPGITQGATHFVLATEQPYWAEGHEPVVVIGAHAFYRLRWI